MKERILKTNNDDGEYLKYRKDLKKFYENETLEYLKSEKLRIEVRYEDRKQNDVYSRLSFIVSIIALCMSILNFFISENERDSVLCPVRPRAPSSSVYFFCYRATQAASSVPLSELKTRTPRLFYRPLHTLPGRALYRRGR